MNREIKFRAWNPERKEMYLPEVFSTNKEGALAPLRPTNDGMRYHKDDSLMQFTGHKDKNSIDLYEGDIISMYYKGNRVLCEIVFNPSGMWSLKWADGYINGHHINPEKYEIVGNVFLSA